MVILASILAVAPFWMVDQPPPALEDLSNPQKFLVHQELYRVLQDVPDAALARISVLKTVHVPNQKVPLVQFTVVGAAAAPWYGLGPGPLVSGLSIASWKIYMDRLLAGQCAYVRVADINTPLVTHLTNMGIRDFDVCPLRDQRLSLIGALFISWSDEQRPVDPERYFPKVQAAAQTISDIVLMKDAGHGD